MKIKEIVVKSNPPRKIDDIDLKSGLRVYYFFGYFFLAGALFMVFTAFLPPHEAGVRFFKIVFGFLVFGGLGYFSLSIAEKKYKARKLAFENGIIIEAIAISQSRCFVFWKSERDYVVTLEYRDINLQIKHCLVQSSDSDFYNLLPIGKKTSGFYDQESGSAFFPIEIGYLIVSGRKN
jgi:hypothetical protein